ncbi:MAG: aldehyde-activating protein [Alphaproteobacteria bacterium HGW-Alphaproteobacteria-12]|nr:MAG: aldehyde-activating protein [Alphaproteobacteria bacterium HGW-Alphaproteobacteria-12]
MPAARTGKKRTLAHPQWVAGRCRCGAVRFEIVYPALWAWHDHSEATRASTGAASMTWAGSWKKRFRLVAGEDDITRYEETDTARSFCARCGTPLFYERGRSRHVVNIPRALFGGRIGREPRYHAGLKEMPDWAYLGEALSSLKGYPGIMIERKRKKKRETSP